MRAATRSAEASLHILVRDQPPRVCLDEPALDLGQENQALNRVVERRVLGEALDNLAGKLLGG